MAKQTTNFAEPFELTIDTIVTGGGGLGRFDGRVIFVPGTVSGCNLQHLEIEAQRRVKHNIVLDCFKRQGGCIRRRAYASK